MEKISILNVPQNVTVIKVCFIEDLENKCFIGYFMAKNLDILSKSRNIEDRTIAAIEANPNE